MLVAVCSRTKKSMAKAEARVRAIAPDHRELRRHAKMEQLFADPDVDAVLLVLPIPLMPAAIEAALRAGKHVISEKPAAPSAEEACRLLGVLRELPAPAPAWLVLENWERKPSVQWLRARLDEGAIGRVVSAHCTHHEVVPPPPRPGCEADDWRRNPTHDGGWMLDVGVHWARALRVLLGEPTACSAAVASLDEALPPCDTLHGWLRFEHCAAAATIGLTFGSSSARSATGGAPVVAEPPPSLRLDGELGTLCWWARDPALGSGARVRLCVRAHGGRGGGGGGGASSSSVAPLPGGVAADTIALDDDWVEGGTAQTLGEAIDEVAALEAARGGGAAAAAAAAGQRGASGPPSCVGCDEGVRDVALVCALLRSAAEGRSVSPSSLLDDGGGGGGVGGGGAAPGQRHSLVRLPGGALCDRSATRRFSPAEVVACASEGEVIRALARAAEAGLVVRPLGTLHSWSGYAAAEGGVCLRLERMDRIVGFGVEPPPLQPLQPLRPPPPQQPQQPPRPRPQGGAVVLLQPGVRLRHLRAILATRGLTLPSWPMLLDQTVGGAAVGSGSHGSSPVEGSLSDLVVSLRLVLPGGGVVELREAEAGAGAGAGAGAEAREPSLRAARLSLGLLGVAVRIGLRCVPAYYVRRHVHVLGVSEFAARAESLCAAYRHLWVRWRLGHEALCVCGLEDVGDLPAHGAARYDGENWYRGPPMFEAPGPCRPWDANGAPTPAPAPATEEQGEEKGQRLEEEHGSAVRWFSMQYALPLASLEELIAGLVTWQQEADVGAAACASREVELKFVGGPGGALLGVNADGPAVCVNVHWQLRVAQAAAPLRALERVLHALGGRPHLGKLHRRLEARDDDSWPQLRLFEAAVTRADPEGRFGGLGVLRSGGDDGTVMLVE